MSDTPTDVVAANIRFWDGLAAAHGHGDDYYDLDALEGGRSSLSYVEAAAVREAVGDVMGRDVLHVQCHLGMDAISLARMGATVTGVDFSPVSIERARELATRCKVDVCYLEANSADLPRHLDGTFDLAYATIGVLCWIEDIDAWMASVHATLRPGGRLVLVDMHPIFLMIDTIDPLHADFPYSFDGPHRFDQAESYAGVTPQETPGGNVNYAHSLGEVVTAAARAGLQVEALHEHLDSEFDPRGDVLVREDDERFRFRLTGQPLPVLYTLVASRTVEAEGP